MVMLSHGFYMVQFPVHQEIIAIVESQLQRYQPRTTIANWWS